MRNITTAILTLALGSVMAPLASAAPLPGFVLAAQTTRFSFYSRGEKVEAAKVERSVDRIEKTLGQKMNGRAEYYRYGSPQELQAGTGHYADGVTFAQSGQVHSTEAVHEHELVHLLAGQLGNPGTFFQEGLAVALGNEGRWQGEKVDKIARRAALSIPRLIAQFEAVDPNVSYPVAGSFVGFLVKTYGAPQVASFFKACGPTGQGREAAFTKTFGTTTAQAAQTWQASL
jgi:hypothetical protein